jgi:type IV pilus assembly protein PilF
MFTIDERLGGLPAVKDQVVQLYQSLNAPHLAVPNRRAGPATAYVLGLRGPTGFAVFVYLYMAESGECAVYVPANGTVGADRYQAEEAGALTFVESMGFIMDNLNFRGRPPEEQEGLIRTLPVFQREPPAPSGDLPGVPSSISGVTRPSSIRSQGVVTLGKLFSAFVLLSLLACVHVSPQDRDKAQIHYELALQSLVKSPQMAMREVEEALKLDPELAEAWHAKALVLHHAFGRLEEARECYAKALALRPAFPDVHANLGNLYMDQKRYDDAIGQYEIALNDVLYGAPYIAHGNMGWAYFKKGDTKSALDHLKAAVTLSPKFCLGYFWLGQVYESMGSLEDGCKYYGRFREHCPDRADAQQLEGSCLLRAGNRVEAKKAFDACVEKATTDDQKDLCRRLGAEL